MKKHRKKFKRLYRNYVDEEYLGMLSGTTWEKIYDEEINDKYGKYMGLIDDECIDLVEANKKKKRIPIKKKKVPKKKKKVPKKKKSHKTAKISKVNKTQKN